MSGFYKVAGYRLSHPAADVQNAPRWRNVAEELIEPRFLLQRSTPILIELVRMTLVEIHNRFTAHQPSSERDASSKCSPVRSLGMRPNGSRLSCGRRARGRKAVEPQIRRLASEATQFLPTCERPAASGAC